MGAQSVTVTFRGVLQMAANSDFRWGLVATDSAITTKLASMRRAIMYGDASPPSPAHPPSPDVSP